MGGYPLWRTTPERRPTLKYMLEDEFFSEKEIHQLSEKYKQSLKERTIIDVDFKEIDKNEERNLKSERENLMYERNKLEKERAELTKEKEELAQEKEKFEKQNRLYDLISKFFSREKEGR